MKARKTLHNVPPIISSSSIGEICAASVVWHSVFYVYLYRAAFTIDYSRRLALLELAAFSLLLSLSIRIILRVYIGIQAVHRVLKHSIQMEWSWWGFFVCFFILFYGSDYCFYKLTRCLPRPSVLFLVFLFFSCSVLWICRVRLPGMGGVVLLDWLAA